MEADVGLVAARVLQPADFPFFFGVNFVSKDWMSLMTMSNSAAWSLVAAGQLLDSLGQGFVRGQHLA